MATVKLFSIARSAPNLSSKVLAANPIVSQKRSKSYGKNPIAILFEKLRFIILATSHVTDIYIIESFYL